MHPSLVRALSVFSSIPSSEAARFAEISAPSAKASANNLSVAVMERLRRRDGGGSADYVSSEGL